MESKEPDSSKRERLQQYRRRLNQARIERDGAAIGYRDALEVVRAEQKNVDEYDALCTKLYDEIDALEESIADLEMEVGQ